jgi:hypothetical protein
MTHLLSCTEYLDDSSRQLLDALGDSPAMLRPKSNGSEDEDIQGALRKFDALIGHVLPFRFYMEKIFQLL